MYDILYDNTQSAIISNHPVLTVQVIGCCLSGLVEVGTCFVKCDVLQTGTCPAALSCRVGWFRALCSARSDAGGQRERRLIELVLHWGCQRSSNFLTNQYGP